MRNHSHLLLIALWFLLLAPAASAEKIPASAEPETVTRTFEVGDGETARTADILSRLMGTDTFRLGDPVTELRVEGSRLVASGPVLDVSRVAAYLALPEPRLPRLVLVEGRNPTAVADRLFTEQAQAESGHQWVAFPNDANNTIYLVASSEESLDAGAARINNLSGLLVRESTGLHEKSDDPSWTDRLHFGGDITFGYTYIDGNEWCEDGSYFSTRARVGVEYRADSWSAAIMAGKTVVEDF